MFGFTCGGGSEGNSSGGVAEAGDGGLGGDPGRTAKLLRWIVGAGVQRGGGFTAAQIPARRGSAERGGGGARVAVAAAGWRGETQGGVGVRIKEVAEDLGVRARKGNQQGSRAEIAAWPLRERGEDGMIGGLGVSAGRGGRASARRRANRR